MYPDGNIDLAEVNKTMADAIQASMPVDPSIAFNATIESHRELWLLLADTVAQSLEAQKLLPLGYEQTMLNMHVAYEHLTLRSLYNLLYERGLLKGV